MDKLMVENLYNGILICSLKNWTTDSCNNEDEFQKYYAEWKKSGTGYILYGSIYSGASKINL